MEQEFKYYAFISYNSKDTAWGKKLQKKLEHYRLPSTLCSEHGWPRTPIKPVFFAPTDIQPGGLSEELQERLKASQNLIVICSPNSAQSKWVGREIEYFHNLGRTNNIHFFIVEGSPHSGDPATECFNPVIDQLGLPEILGANIHEKVYRQPWLNKERAYAQLISKLLGVEFDTIWQRHKRRLIRRTIIWTMGILAVLITLFAVWKMNQPFDVQTRLHEASFHNEALPPLKDAVVTITLDNETKTDTLRTMDASVVFANIPHRFLNKNARFTVTCRDFLNVDTILPLTPDVKLDIRRDPSVYGDIHFRLFNPNDETFFTNEPLTIGEFETTSDDQGRVSCFIPLESQRKTYKVTTTFPLLNDTIHAPCGNDDVILSQ